MTIELSITSLAHGGHGIGRIDGQVCFVPHALPGDVVRVRVVREAKRVLWAEIEQVAEASPDRIPGVTPTGHAMWLHFAYPAQAVWKRRLVQEQLARIGGIDTEPAWAGEPSLHHAYRTRAELHGDGQHFGFYAPGTHDIVDGPSSPLNHPRLNDALNRLHTLRPRGPVTVTVNPEGDDVLVWTRQPWDALRAAFPQTNGPRDPDRHQFMFDGVPVVNGAFSQASLLLNRLLVETVRACAGNGTSLLDLYCGSGNFALPLAQTMRVTGIDHQRHAIDAAAATGRGDFRCGGEPAMAKALAETPWDVVVLDPPRQGARALMPALAACEADAVVYVSCDPATLARDLAVLARAGWRLSECTVVDLFPHTAHIETVVHMVR